MRIKILVLVTLSFPFYLYGQRTIISAPFYPNDHKTFNEKNVAVMHHNISINPLNIFLFQQIGLTYEYRQGKLGFGITPGYIYPNKQEYSNWFIAGPVKYGSLGWYSGWFVIPQLNLYLTKQHDSDEAGVWYLALKIVYKNMQIDTTKVTIWENEGDGFTKRRKMMDKVNVYGGFIDMGYRYFLSHFFFDLNFGVGPMWVNHNMIVYAEANGMSYIPMHYLTPPEFEQYHHWGITVNFTLNIGAAF